MARSKLNILIQEGDRFMFFAILALMLASLLAIYSSSSVLAYQKAGGDTIHYLLRHTVLMSAGFIALIFTLRIRPRVFSHLAEVLLVLSCILLALTLIVGSSVNGSSRWLNLGFVQFQPSEIAKISIVLFAAKKLGQNDGDPDKAFWPVMIALVCVCGLIMLENLSTSILVGVTVFTMLFIGRVSPLKLGGTALVAIALVSLVILFAPLVSNIFPRANTWRARIERFVNSDDSPASADANYQAEQAMAAVSTGGITGCGPGNSYMKNFLPMAFSDFIFSIILEEYGMFGCCGILFAYFVIFARARIVAAKCRKPFHLYTIMGLAILLTFQAIINMMVGVGLMPVTGQTLPMVSMGGTSNLITGIAYGIMLSISAETARLNGESANVTTPRKPSPALNNKEVNNASASNDENYPSDDEVIEAIQPLRAH